MPWGNIEHLKQLKETKMLHESVKDTYKEVVVKESEGFRLTVKKHEVISPKGLFSIDMLQESLKDGDVVSSQTYNFFMTKDEMATLASALTS
jgi:hypothetical protein